MAWADGKSKVKTERSQPFEVLGDEGMQRMGVDAGKRCEVKRE